MSSNIHKAMKNISEGTRMFMYVVLYWTAQVPVCLEGSGSSSKWAQVHGTVQIPVGKAQNQAQNELKQTRIGHQGICSM